MPGTRRAATACALPEKSRAPALGAERRCDSLKTEQLTSSEHRVRWCPTRDLERCGVRGRMRPYSPTNQCSTWELPESETNPDSSSVLLRKEVIQPHLPVRLPCYDFTPIADPTFDGSLPEGWDTGFGCYQLSWCDGRCVQGPGTYSPQQC